MLAFAKHLIGLWRLQQDVSWQAATEVNVEVQDGEDSSLRYVHWIAKVDVKHANEESADVNDNWVNEEESDTSDVSDLSSSSVVSSDSESESEGERPSEVLDEDSSEVNDEESNQSGGEGSSELEDEESGEIVEAA